MEKVTDINRRLLNRERKRLVGNLLVVRITRYERQNTNLPPQSLAALVRNNYFLEDRERLTTGCDLLSLL
ncbi:hypothetical protein ES703_41152 [subsurface metagenome]